MTARRFWLPTVALLAITIGGCGYPAPMSLHDCALGCESQGRVMGSYRVGRGLFGTPPVQCECIQKPEPKV